MSTGRVITVENLEKVLGRPLTRAEKLKIAKQPITWAQLNAAIAKGNRDEVKKEHYRKPNGKCNCSGLVWYSEEHLIKVTRNTLGGYYGDRTTTTDNN